MDNRDLLNDLDLIAEDTGPWSDLAIARRLVDGGYLADDDEALALAPTIREAHEKGALLWTPERVTSTAAGHRIDLRARRD